MAPCVIWVKFCPRRHAVSPLPTTGSLESQSISLDIRNCDVPDDIRDPLLASLRYHHPDVPFDAERLKKSSILAHPINSQCDISLNLQALEKYHQCGPPKGELWRSEFAKRVVCLHVDSNEEEPEFWTLPQGPVKPAESGKPEQVEQSGSGNEKGPDSKQGKGKGRVSGTPATDRRTKKGRKSSQSGRRSSGRSRGKDTDDDDEDEEEGEENEDNPSDEEDEPDGVGYVFIRTCPRYPAGEGTDIDLVRVEFNWPLSRDTNFLLKKMSDKLKSHYPDGHVSEKRPKDHPASQRDCTQWDIRTMIEHCKFTEKNPPWTPENISKQIWFHARAKSKSGAPDGQQDASAATSAQGEQKTGRSSKQTGNGKGKPANGGIRNQKGKTTGQGSSLYDEPAWMSEKNPRYVYVEACSKVHEKEAAAMEGPVPLRIDPPFNQNKDLTFLGDQFATTTNSLPAGPKLDSFHNSRSWTCDTRLSFKELLFYSFPTANELEKAKKEKWVLSLDYEFPRYLYVHVCERHHGAGPLHAKTFSPLKINPPHCKNLQDIAKKLEPQMKNHKADFSFDSESHTATFHKYFGPTCAPFLDFDDLLQNYTFPISNTPMHQVTNKVVKMHIDGEPDLINVPDEAPPKIDGDELVDNAEIDQSGDTGIFNNDDGENADGQDEDGEDEDGENRDGENRDGENQDGNNKDRDDQDYQNQDGDNDEDEEDSDQQPPPVANGRSTTNKRKSNGGSSRPAKRRSNGAQSARYAREEEDRGVYVSDSDDSNNAQAPLNRAERRFESRDVALSARTFEKLEDRTAIRVGVLQSEDKYRRPGRDNALPMRSIVVALVDTTRRGRPVVEAFYAIDAWTISGFRVGDYPSGSKWKYPSQRSPRFTPDDYWKKSWEDQTLEQDIVHYYVFDWQLPEADNDSALSAQARAGPTKKKRRRVSRIQEVIQAPLRPNLLDEDITTKWGENNVGQVEWDNNERVHAVICFANALTDDQSLGTPVNLQASLPYGQTLDAFRRYIKNTKIHDTKTHKRRGNLKQMLRRQGFDYFADFQVWIMPLHSGDNAHPEDAFCWDQDHHSDLTIGDFVHSEDHEEYGKAEIFIEIRIIEHGDWYRMQKTWWDHGRKYHDQRTPKYGWKTQANVANGCLLDDEEDKGHIANDNNTNTLPPRRRGRR